jgi:hypothetical protein
MSDVPIGDIAPLHSITSSARASTDCGTSRPSAFAVLRSETCQYQTSPIAIIQAGPLFVIRLCTCRNPSFCEKVRPPSGWTAANQGPIRAIGSSLSPPPFVFRPKRNSPLRHLIRVKNMVVPAMPASPTSTPHHTGPRRNGRTRCRPSQNPVVHPMGSTELHASNVRLLVPAHQ